MIDDDYTDLDVDVPSFARPVGKRYMRVSPPTAPDEFTEEDIEIALELGELVHQDDIKEGGDFLATLFEE